MEEVRVDYDNIAYLFYTNPNYSEDQAARVNGCQNPRKYSEHIN